MVPPIWKIEGPFAGVDANLIFMALGVTVLVVALTAVVAHQLARIQPKPSKLAPKSGTTGEFDEWTERPKAPPRQDDYYTRYGSQPGPSNRYVSPRAPPAPPSPLGEVVVNLGGTPVQEEGWVEAPTPPAAAPFSPPPLQPPPRPTGPTDEVVAPSHSRRGRDTSTGMLPAEEMASAPFERYSTVAGATAPRTSAAPVPPPPPTPRGGEQDRVKAPQALPEASRPAGPTAFRGPPAAPSVVGTVSTGLKEGEALAAGKKAIRCPKCATVFAGPETRPATVKCPACGTSGVLK